MSNGFHEVDFPLSIAFNTTGGPERRNEIVALTSGHEKRNARFADSRRHFDAGSGMRAVEDLQTVAEFFEARHGSLYGFRFRDPFDHRSARQVTPLDQVLGVGDGETKHFALVKQYGVGADAYRRGIDKPVAGSVRAAVDGAETTDFTLKGGTVLFDVAPMAGQSVTAGFLFDVPVRFDMERLVLNLSSFRAGIAPSIPLIEVKP
ncbi:DUF2460 domain-containing protein [Limoniibacter endophyticus]|uniref:Glycoside hydrolase family 24 n=1 Tax=Limoniibacter endophyticus TaxID=1565040 RepID=A0A8J3DRE0_9HYPH|nr:DUF2460 domain-containing protein [Limoniibacter endophyticus]GHC69296.1 glycoside hydrolase family 24 [Limoniibacter endophyticus]